MQRNAEIFSGSTAEGGLCVNLRGPLSCAQLHYLCASAFEIEPTGSPDR